MAIKQFILDNPELWDDLVKTYRHKEPQFYDFFQDRSGELIWYSESKKATQNYPLDLQLSSHPSIDEVETLVIKICNKFKDLIENNGLSSLLYDKYGKPKHEQASQLLFYGISEAYCSANNIMISRESDSGRGPVDFKFGSNMENSVLVELKKSTNTSGLKKGVERQLPEYMKSEQSKRAIYLVIDVGYTKASIKNLNAVNEKTNGTSIKIIQIDGQQKPSASNL